MSSSSIDQTRDNDHIPDEDELIQLAWTVEKCISENATIEIHAKWWGYTIELNARAVEILDNCLEFLKEKFGKHFKGEIPKLISLCIQFKRRRLVKAVERSSDGFARMVSPWVIPFALAVVRGGMQKDDQNLWFTVWDNEEKKWGEDAEFNECMSRNGPALAQHGDFLYCVHRGAGEDDHLWWTKYSTNDGWSDDTVFPNHRTYYSPSLVEFKNTLYCFHRGPTDLDHALYYCTFDDGRNSWNDDVKISVGGEYFYSYSGCAVTVFGGELHLVFQIYSPHDKLNNWFHHLIFDGTTWRNNQYHPQGSTLDTPALVTYKNKLLLVLRGEKNQDLYYFTGDGLHWSEPIHMEKACSKYGPGLAVFDDKVFCAHRGKDHSENIWYSTYNGSTWTTDTMSDACTGAPPALACYTDPQCNSDNYTDSKNTVARLICVHRGWG
jgi:hypothetical protein